MQQGSALGSREVIAVFRKYGRLVNSDNDTIEWRLFCSVLKHLEPAYYTDGVLDALFQQALTLMNADEEVITDSAWALSYISDGPSERISAVLATGVLPRCIELLAHPSPRVQTPTLRTVGNIVSGDDNQTQEVLAAGVLTQLRILMGHTKRSIQKESCWAISNILAGSRMQIQDVLNAELVPPLLELLGRASFEVKKEVAWAFANATSGGSTQQIHRLVVDYGCVAPMVEALTALDNKLGGILMSGLENILNAGDRVMRNEGLEENPFIAYVVEANGVETIRRYLDNGPQEVAEKAETLLTLITTRER